jgi:hypothetical protein
VQNASVINPIYDEDLLYLFQKHLGPDQPSESVPMHIVLKEEIEIVSRGIPFHHLRDGGLGQCPYELCKAL